MIKINRLNCKTDYYLDYDIYINNIKIITISNNEIKNINLKPGNYYIEIKSGFSKSKKINFELSQNQIIEFEIKPKHQNNVIFKIIAKLLFNNAIINIKIKSDIYL